MDAAALSARWIAGRVLKEPVSDHKHADERCCRGRRSRVVLTPRRWRQVRGMASRPNRARTGRRIRKRRWQKSPVTGESAKETVKTIACGNAGRSGVLVVTRVRSTNTKCTRGRGCSGHPAFPTPSLGRKINARLGRIASRGANVCLETRVWN